MNKRQQIGANDGIAIFAEQGNYVSIHNLVFDYLMPRIKPTSFKVLCLIIRDTRGWNRQSASISYSQIKNKTGIKSDQTITSALEELLSIGCISKRDGEAQFDSTSYSLNLGFKIHKNETQIPTSKNEVPTSNFEASATTKNEVDTTSKFEVAPTSNFEDIYSTSYYIKDKSTNRGTNRGTNNGASPQENNFLHPERLPNTDSPLAMEIRRICRKPIMLSDRDRENMRRALMILEGEGATVEQVQEFGKRVHLHWCGRDGKTGQKRPPGILQVAENWLAVLDIELNEEGGELRHEQPKLTWNERRLMQIFGQKSVDRGH